MRPFILYSLLITAATIAVYWPVGGHDFVNYDDPMYVTRNPHVQAGLTMEGLRWAFTSVSTGNWHPLTWLSHMLDVAVFDLRAGYHHWMSVILHILATLLLLAFLGTTTRAWGPSAISAAIFALHPLHVESVAWIAERKDVLCGVFFFLTLHLYAGYSSRRGDWQTLTPTRHPERQRRISGRSGVGEERSFAGAQDDGNGHRLSSDSRKNSYFYLVALFAFACALLSKPMAVTLPCVLLLVDVWPLRRLDIREKSFSQSIRDAFPLVIEKFPFFALSLVVAAVTLVLQGRVESVRGIEQTSMGLRVANALVAYVAYVGKTFYPIDLAVYYPYPADGLPGWKVGCSALLLALITLTVIAAARRYPWLPVGWFWYLGMLVPVIGLIQVGSQAMADRYMYLPMTGLLVAVVWWFADRWDRRRPNRALGVALAVGLCVAMGVQTRQQVAYWHDSIALFEHALAVAPDSATVRTNLGGAQLEKNSLDEAREHLERAIQLKPNDVNAHNNLGIALLRMQKLDSAIQVFSTAIQLDPMNPELHYNLGLAYKAAGQLDSARLHFATAIQLNPAHANAHFELGDVYLTIGDGPQAALHYREVLRLQPDRVPAWFNTGIALASAGQFEESIPYFEHGLSIWPGDSEGTYYLAKVYAALGRTESAIKELEELQSRKTGFSAEAQALLSELKQQTGPPE